MTAISRDSIVHGRERGKIARLVKRSRVESNNATFRAAARSRVRTPYWLVVAVVVGDMIAVAVAFAASQAIWPMTQFPRVLFGASGAALAWPFLLAIRGSYTTAGLTARKSGRQLVSSAVLLVALFAVVAAALGEKVPRTTVAVVAPLLLAISFMTRQMVKWRLARLRRGGVDLRRVVAVGPGGAVSEMVDQLATVTDHPIVVVAACTESDGIAEDIPVAAEIDTASDWKDNQRAQPTDTAVMSVLDAVRKYGADTVTVVPGSAFNGRRLQALARALREYDVDLVSVPGFLDVASHRVELDRAGALTLLHIRPLRSRGWAPLGKFVLDRVAAAALLAVSALPMLGIAIAVQLTSRGPALFTQTRLGKNGKPFTMFKFRTMVANAEALRGELLPANDHDGGVMFKLRDDPRVTPIGNFLRRSSIDELPQLINVLRGDMSLVGPRPPLPEEVEKYDDFERHRMSVRPGMTGLWQVSGRSNLTWDETVRIDARYVDNWSLGQDANILWRTWNAVLRGNGAY